MKIQKITKENLDYLITLLVILPQHGFKVMNSPNSTHSSRKIELMYFEDNIGNCLSIYLDTKPEERFVPENDVVICVHSRFKRKRDGSIFYCDLHISSFIENNYFDQI